MIAAAAMALSSLSVVSNANRLRTFKPRKLDERVRRRDAGGGRVAPSQSKEQSSSGASKTSVRRGKEVW